MFLGIIMKSQQRTSVAPVVDLSARNKAGINLRRIQPVRALPITECAPPSFLPKGAVDDSVNLFGEYIVKNEYQPAVPNEYITFKRKAEEREAREKLAREVAERLSRDHKEEAKKRQKGAAIAPPQALLEPSSPPKVSAEADGCYTVSKSEGIGIEHFATTLNRFNVSQRCSTSIETFIIERVMCFKTTVHHLVLFLQPYYKVCSFLLKESNSPSSSMPPPAFLPSFGKATSKGLGVAANIMSKFGYKHGAGLGRDEQGMSTALSVEKLGKNAGLIINESQGIPPASSGPPMGVQPINMTEAMRSSTKVLMLTA
ncbi:unnamed protein product [Heligmosomoides polygyrus]|uniref:G-patch domain-containing protein n=1 Tax=Heligmosomoides polygyrus TaxID=6339 RepID=A0A183F569_HELPZ|nr:unnamed protein product [Heligmosomoides polygyrus]